MKLLHRSWLVLSCAVIMLNACSVDNPDLANSGKDPTDSSSCIAQATPEPVFTGLAGTIKTAYNTLYCARFVTEGSTIYGTMQGLPPQSSEDGYFWGSLCGITKADMNSNTCTPLAGGPVYTIAEGILSYEECVARYNASVGFADGVGASAKFAEPWDIVMVGDYLYVADAGNHCIRKVHKQTGEVVTLSGTSGTSGVSDGSADQAQFQNPLAICSDGKNLFVGDSNMVRMVDMASGQVRTLAGSTREGQSDGTGSEASFWYITGLAADDNSVYVADFFNHAIRKIEKATGKVTTLAGGYVEGLLNYSSIDGTGLEAQFTSPADIVILGGQLFVADNIRIRQVDPATGKVTTIAGNPVPVDYDDHGAWVLEEGNAMEVHIVPSNLSVEGQKIYFQDNGQIRVLE